MAKIPNKLLVPSLIISLLLLLVASFFIVQSVREDEITITSNGEILVVEKQKQNETGELKAEVVTDNLNIPWEVEFLPDGSILITERPGSLVIIGKDKQRVPVEGVRHIGEGGLLGMALHPKFSSNNFVYLYLTFEENGSIGNKVERYTLSGSTLSQRTVILEGIQGASNHNGGRIAFGPDGYLYIATGDAGNESLSQVPGSLNGKVLRVRDDGSIPGDNPFNSPVYSLGHRNVQGLAWDEKGNLWATEHGRSGIQSGYDELNLVQKGKNYGWPQIQGDTQQAGMERPAIHSGPSETWAPSGAAYLNGSVFFSGLRGETLYEAQIKDGKVTSLRKHFEGTYGRLRAVKVGPDGFLYFSTSNRDGRGRVRENDDILLKVKI